MFVSLYHTNVFCICFVSVIVAFRIASVDCHQILLWVSDLFAFSVLSAVCTLQNKFAGKDNIFSNFCLTMFSKVILKFFNKSQL